MQLELKEARELLQVYETKNKGLMEDLQNTTSELQSNKREMIGFNEINNERENRIAELKREVRMNKAKADEYEVKLGTLEIHFQKNKEQLDATRADHDDQVEKLHTMNKARHEIENKLQDEVDRNKLLEIAMNNEKENLEKRIQEIEEADKTIN